MKINNEQQRKLGGFGTHVQIDETMLNYKCKNHRSRSAENKTEALTIVEVVQGKITRVYARVIINKSISSIIPVVIERVVAGS
jgi:hypothetical protein